MKSIAFVPILVGVAFVAVACGSKSDSAASTDSNSNDPIAAPKPTMSGATAATVGELKAPVTYNSMKHFLELKCIACHGVGKRIGGKFNFATYAGMMKGGEDGIMVKPGDPDNSPIIAYLKGTKKPQMPLRQPVLADSDIQAISDWIKDGAKEK